MGYATIGLYTYTSQPCSVQVYTVLLQVSENEHRIIWPCMRVVSFQRPKNNLEQQFGDSLLPTEILVVSDDGGRPNILDAAKQGYFPLLFTVHAVISY